MEGRDRKDAREIIPAEEFSDSRTTCGAQRMKTRRGENRNGYVCRKQARTAQKDETPALRCLTQNALSHDGLITIGTHSKP